MNYSKFTTTLNQCAKLEDNWNGYGAEKVSSQSIETAKKVYKLGCEIGLNFDILTPLPDGLQFDLRCGSYFFEIEIRGRIITLIKFDKNDNYICDLEFTLNKLDAFKFTGFFFPELHN